MFSRLASMSGWQSKRRVRLASEKRKASYSGAGRMALLEGDLPMKQNRRNFMKGTGAVWAMAVAGRLPATLTKAKPAGPEAHGMTRGLILLNIRRGAEYRLGVKNEEGILDEGEAAKILHKHGQSTIEDLLQNEDGPSLSALVNASAKSKEAQKAYLKE